MAAPDADRNSYIWMVCVRGDLQEVGASETVAGDRAEWRAAISRLTPS